MSLKKIFIQIYTMVLFFTLILFTMPKAYALSSYPKEYYPSESMKTPTKSQGSTGACWDFAGMATLESYLSKNGLFKESLSEQDTLNWASKGQSAYGWNVGTNSGGTSITMMGYLTSGNGPKTNSQVPFGSRNKSNNNISNFPLRVSGIKTIDINTNSDVEREKIKKAVLEYGAVCSGYGSVYNGHAISIVGWDDSKRSWYIKDSLTKSYRLIPYETKGLLTSCINYSITSVEKVKPNENIYQHDNFGVISDFRPENPSTKTKFANVFAFNSAEVLDSVMFETSCEKANYKVYYAPVLSDKINTDESSWKLISSGVVPYSGYITVKPDKTFKLPNGKGAIVVEIDCKSIGTVATIGCQGNYMDLRTKQEKGKSFIITESGSKDILDYNRALIEGISALSIKAVTHKE